ncbi:MAG: ATPase domain-containing protein [Nanoarchaeota archaeon]
MIPQKTGIPGLDEVLNGGLPKYTLTLLAGTSGTGKTLFGFQWLFNGVRQGENGVYISITEPLFMAVKNIESIGFYDRTAIEQGKLRLSDIGENLDYEKIDPQSLLRYIEKQVKETNAKRVVIDSITGILCAINDKEKITRFMFELKKLLGTLGCTTICLSKVTERDRYSVYGIEELVPDGVISLTSIIGENQMVRNMQIIKMRGMDFRSGAVIFEILPSGIHIYPKISVTRVSAATEYKNRLSVGINRFGDLCGGGIPQGHTILISGNTGSGKTTFALQFLLSGLENGKCAIYVSLEESAVQIKKNAAEHGWDTGKYEKAGSLIFISPSLLDTNTDKLLYQITDAVNSTGAERFVLDSVSSLESSVLNKAKVREFLIQLTDLLKSRGVTSMLTYLSEKPLFSATSEQLLGSGASSDLRMSSITDGIILLRFVERKQSVAKLLNVLKMRGSAHDKNIWEFKIGKNGIEIEQIFKR